MVVQWDAQSGEQIMRFELKHVIFDVKYSLDGTKLAGGGGSSSVVVWHAETGELIRVLRYTHACSLWSISFSPDGTRIASGGADRYVRVWDISSGRQVVAFGEHEGGVLACCWSPCGQSIVSGSHDRSVRVWDIPGRTLQTCMFGHNVGDHGCTCREGETIAACPLVGHRHFVRAVAFSRTGLVASGSTDGTCKVWDAATGRLVRSMEMGAMIFGLDFGEDWLRDELCLAFAMGQKECPPSEHVICITTLGRTRWR
jgi:WD40 repeat protein